MLNSELHIIRGPPTTKRGWDSEHAAASSIFGERMFNGAAMVITRAVNTPPVRGSSESERYNSVAEHG